MRYLTLMGAAAMHVLAGAGLAWPAPRVLPRRSIDLSAPIIPPAPRRLTPREKVISGVRLAAAEAKRQRRRARNLRIVAAGGMVAA